MRVDIRNWAERWLGLRSRGWKKRAAQAAGCLTVALATAWAVPASGVTIHLEVAPSEDLSAVFVKYNNYVPNSSFGIAVFSLGDLPGGQTTSFDHDIPSWSMDNVLGPWAGYMLFGLHGAAGSQGISMSFPDDSLVTSNGSWDSFIASTYGPGNYYPEEEIVDTWNENWAYTLSISFPNHVHLDFGQTATIVNMSEAAYGGYAIATVPEPHAWVFLVSGAGVAILAVRRRRS
jgi:hypothetical protein